MTFDLAQVCFALATALICLLLTISSYSIIATVFWPTIKDTVLSLKDTARSMKNRWQKKSTTLENIAFKKVKIKKASGICCVRCQRTWSNHNKPTKSD